MGKKSIPRRVFELLSGHPQGLTTEKIAEHLEGPDEYQVQNAMGPLVARKLIVGDLLGKGARKLYRINPEHPQADFHRGRPQQEGFQEANPGDLFGDGKGMEGSSPAPPAEPHPEPQPDRGHSGQEHPAPPLETTDPDQPTIAGVSIPVDEKGRVSLNALHRASGTADHKRPKKWLETQQANELWEELVQGPISDFGELLHVTHGGARPGTYAHPDLAISYAGWISPRFQLQVNRIFRQYQEGTLPAHPEPAPQPPLPKYDATRSLDQYLEMAQLLGVDPAMAKSVAARLTQEETGLPVTELLKEGGHTVEEKDRFLCPRDLGALVDMLARAINLLLEQEGYQYRPKQGKYKWLPTSEAEGYYAWHPIQDPNGNARYQLLWDRDILNLLGFL